MDHYLRQRLQTLIAARLVVGTVLLGSATLIQISGPGSFPVDPFFFIIGLTYALSVVYLATLRWALKHQWLVDLQFAADAILVSAFIHLTGGITSYFSSLYLLPIIASATVRSRRGALQIAALSGVLYLGLVTGQYNVGALPQAWRIFPFVLLPTARFAQYTVTINLFGFVAVALLSGSLAERLRSADVSLEHASSQIANLRAFNDYVVESLISGLVTTDAAYRVITFNRAATAITGVPVEDARGRDIRDILQFPAALRARLGALEDARSVRLDLEYRTPQGKPLDIGLTATTLTLPPEAQVVPEAVSTGYLMTFQDVTDVKRLERDSRFQQRMAAVGEMAAGIAHEIRNPLASMSGSIQVLRQELPLSEEQGQLMDIVLRESERLNETIRVFLAYARPQRFAVTRVDVGKVVRDMTLLLRTSPYMRDTHVVDIEVPLTPMWYEADESQLREILWNIATNGLRAMASGGHLRLAASIAEQPASSAREVVIEVEDHGCGIPADELDGIFQPFRGSFENGTGLGLAVVHRLVTEYGGVIEVSSQMGKGTTVKVQLPIGGRATVPALDSVDDEPLRAAV